MLARELFPELLTQAGTPGALSGYVSNCANHSRPRPAWQPRIQMFDRGVD